MARCDEVLDGIKSALSEIEADYEKVFDKGVKKAGQRVRKATRAMRKLAKELGELALKKMKEK